jgi:hypothetical protein
MADLPLCTTTDVARYLGLSAPSNLEDLDPYLDEATDYLKRVLLLNFQSVGTTCTDHFFNVREQSRLRLRDLYPFGITAQVTMIANTLPPFIDPWILTENNDFVTEDDRYIRITSSLYFRIVGYDYAYGKRTAILWDRVDVTYQACGVIPATIKEGAALLAAAFFKQGPYDATGMQSEHMGDYSYTRSIRGAADPVQGAIPAKVRALIRLHRGPKSRST